MTLYTLVDIDGNILQSMFTEDANYSHSEDSRLLPDTCPTATIDYDPAYYSAYRITPVAPEATKIEYSIERKSNDTLRSQIIISRNNKISAEMWKYQRIDRHNRLNLPQIDDIVELDKYIDALCKLPQQQAFIDNDFENIDWPLYPDATPVVFFR